MASFAEQITDIAIPEVAGSEGAEAPRIWWRNGVKQAKTGGFFYTSDKEFPGGLEAPWATKEVYDGENGYVAERLRVAVLAKRSQPFRDPKDASGKRDRTQPRQWGLKWEPGMQIYTELLCFIEGYAGPVIWCADGLTGKAVDAALKAYKTGLLAEGSRVAKRALPWWSFWLPVSTKLAGDGKVAYEDTGFGSFVTPPALALGGNALDTLFVGAEVLAAGAEVLNDSFAAWAKTIPPHRLPGNVVEAEVVEIKALPAGRNVPQAIGEDEDGPTY